MSHANRIRSTSSTGFLRIAGYYGRVYRLGQRVKTPKGDGTITGATNYVEVQLDGNDSPEDFHPYDVESIDARGAA